MNLVYTRVSTSEQSESLPVQERKCRDFAHSLGLSISNVFFDAESGRTAGRAQLQAMLNFCRKNKVKNVIVADLSRLARNVADQGNIIAMLVSYGTRLRSVDESSLQDDATGKLGKNIIGAFSQFFSDSLSERTKYRMSAASVFSNVFQTLAHSNGTSPSQFFTATQAQSAFNSALAANGVSTTARLDLSRRSQFKGGWS